MEVSVSTNNVNTFSVSELDYIRETIENMNKLGMYQRPIHCTDIKRESLYIKDDDNWEKDTNKEKIRKAIKDVSTKQFCALSKWTKENPDFQNNEFKQNFDYFNSKKDPDFLNT